MLLVREMQDRVAKRSPRADDDETAAESKDANLSSFVEGAKHLVAEFQWPTIRRMWLERASNFFVRLRQNSTSPYLLVGSVYCLLSSTGEMVKKAIDARIPALIKNGVQEKKRSIFVVVGDKGRDQIVNLHWLLSQSQVASRPSVLWMYKKDLMGFTSHRKKREQKIKKEIKRGIRDPNDAQDPFELFIAVTNIRYTYYKESEKILGQTFGMCVLQDFEALTPNLLARTIETVEGGGIIVILLKTMTSLKQLYTMSMDIHSRYRTEARDDVTARFNERFILSLTSNQHALVVDDELNVLPVSGAKNVKLLPPALDNAETKEAADLKALKKNLEDTQPAGALVSGARTLDQAKAVLTFIDAIAEKTLRSTVALTAGRGRGKSAALGLAVSSAIAHGYSNIFITSPSPENLKTLFEFIFKGFDALKYTEHLDYEIIQSTNPAFNKAIVRVNIFRGHRQTIQYIKPEDASVLGQAELVVIDEAAAIPLPLVQKLIGPYLVFMASTINGYEGTGRSLSLKLVQQLRDQSRGFVGGKKKAVENGDEVVDRSGKTSSQGQGSTMGGRTLREITLTEPIRYALGDPVEAWLNKLLCLDATVGANRFPQGCPHPSQCQLYAVNRDTLFSFHPVSETFLQRMMALYVSSHYKNSPNDLQLMSDAPAHQLFVLLPPIKEDDKGLPEPLCVVQLALEGQISKSSVLNNLSRGQRAGGDLIPWLVSQQFQDDEFAGLSGARVVRIATNPEYVKMGYGTRSMELLNDWYAGKITNLSEEVNAPDEEITRVTDQELEGASLATDSIKIRDPRKMPPLLLKLSEKKPDMLSYLGVSYGLTPQLHKFWKRGGYVPVYLRQTANDLTGEHTCVMIKVLDESEGSWLASFSKDFKKRFMSLLGYQFRVFPAISSLSIMESADAAEQLGSAMEAPVALTKRELDITLSPFDLKRLDSYSNNLLDYHVIVDLLPLLAELYFSGRLTNVKLSGVQSCILLSLGLQRKVVDDIERELNLPNQQILAMLVKIVRKVATHLREIQERAIEETMPSADKRVRHHIDDEAMSGTDAEENTYQPLKQTLEEDLEEGADQVTSAIREKQKELINALDLQSYEIEGSAGEWQTAERQIRDGNGKKATTVGVKSGKEKRRAGAGESAAEILAAEEKAAKRLKKNAKKARS